jgi:hypothetical protein
MQSLSLYVLAPSPLMNDGICVKQWVHKRPTPDNPYLMIAVQWLWVVSVFAGAVEKLVFR